MAAEVLRALRAGRDGAGGVPAVCVVQPGEARIRRPRRRLAVVVGAPGDQGRAVAAGGSVGWAKAHRHGRADAVPPVRTVGWAKAHHAPRVGRCGRGRRRRWAFAHPTIGSPAVRRFARRVGATHHRRPSDAMPVGMGAPRAARRRSGVRGAGGCGEAPGNGGFHAPNVSTIAYVLLLVPTAKKASLSLSTCSACLAI